MDKSMMDFFHTLYVFQAVRVTIEFSDASHERMYSRELLKQYKESLPVHTDEKKLVPKSLMGIELNLVSSNA